MSLHVGGKGAWRKNKIIKKLQNMVKIVKKGGSLPHKNLLVVQRPIFGYFKLNLIEIPLFALLKDDFLHEIQVICSYLKTL